MFTSNDQTIFCFQSSQEFDNPAFDLDENNIEFSPDCKLADIVQQTLRRNSDFGYIHPYGRGNLYTTVFLGEKSKAADSSGGMLAFWVAFIIMVVGLAGAIIFMAGIVYLVYRLKIIK